MTPVDFLGRQDPPRFMHISWTDARSHLHEKRIELCVYSTELAGMTSAIFFIAPPALLERDRSMKIDASSVATYRSQGFLLQLYRDVEFKRR